MKDKQLSFSQVLDIYGFRVVVDNVPTCYLALGALHSLFKPVPGKFKDYIAIPKANGYQSLHTTLIGPYGTPVEVQIRTREMHHVAQDGVAAHWLVQGHRGIERRPADQDAQVAAVAARNADHRFVGILRERQDRPLPGRGYVFTPKGKILAMPRGATVVDFAYAVHTDVGHHCSAARVNHELAPFAYRTEERRPGRDHHLAAGQPEPGVADLHQDRPGAARFAISCAPCRTRSARLGERLLRQELLSLGVVPISIPAEAWEALAKSGGQKTMEDVYRHRPRQAPALRWSPAACWRARTCRLIRRAT